MRKLKSFGQHFLHNEQIAQAIVDSLLLPETKSYKVVEVGPGEGVLTKYLVKKDHIDFYAVEVDRRLPALLIQKYPVLKNRIINVDVLKLPFDQIIDGYFSIIGNFPYNISSQILFKVLAHRQQVQQVVGMFQREVAQRIASHSGNKSYGVISVLVQVYYKVTYLFEVDAQEFIPPPKVQSAVIRLERRYDLEEKVDYKRLARVVKQGFGQRRKKLRNALKGLPLDGSKLPEGVLQKRAEQLSVEDFITLSHCLT